MVREERWGEISLNLCMEFALLYKQKLNIESEKSNVKFLIVGGKINKNAVISMRVYI